MGWIGHFAPMLALVVLGGCRGVTTQYTYPDDLIHPNYVKRTKAVQQFVRERDASQLPEAFDLLLDEEDHIRSLAYSALKKMSPGGRDFGYRTYLPESVRIGIVQRWVAWWESEQGEGGTSG